MMDNDCGIDIFPSKLEFQCNKPLLKLVQNLYPSKNTVKGNVYVGVDIGIIHSLVQKSPYNRTCTRGTESLQQHGEDLFDKNFHSQSSPS